MPKVLKALRKIAEAADPERFAAKGFDPDAWYHGGTLGMQEVIEPGMRGSLTQTPAAERAFFLTRSPEDAAGFAAQAGGEVTPLYMRGSGVPAIDWSELAGNVPIRSVNGQRLLAGVLEDNPDVPGILFRNAGDAMKSGGSADMLAVMDPTRLRRGDAALKDLDANSLVAGVGASPGLLGLDMGNVPMEQEYPASKGDPRRARQRRSQRGLQEQRAGIDKAAEVEKILNLFDMPTRGLYGLGTLGLGLLEGDPNALMRATEVVNRPLDETAHIFGDYVFDKTGSPALGAAGYTAANLFGPI